MRSRAVAPWILAASIVAASFWFVLFGLAGGFAGGSASAWVSYYIADSVGSITNFFYDAVLSVCLLVLLLVIWSFSRSFVVLFFPKFSTLKKGRGKVAGKKQDAPRDFFVDIAKRSREVLLILPAILFVTVIALAMGEANAFARDRLQDAVVIGWEHALFGTYVFAALGAINYPVWLISFVVFSFDNMALILIGAGALLAYVSRRHFRELLVAFSLGILIMVPLWLTLPVLSPQDRFINNVYQLPQPPQVALAVESYHPSPQISAFLTAARAEKANLPALPTSTIPSAHVFWAALAGYYLFHARRVFGWIALPFLIASTFGTVLLAQHYFMDVPAGIAVAALAIWLAHDVEPAYEKVTSAVSRGTPGESL